VQRKRLIEARLLELVAEADPVSYDLPDLLYERGEQAGVWNPEGAEVTRLPLESPETEEEFEARQDRDLSGFVRGTLYFVKDGKRERPVLIPPMLELLCDLFYGRVNKAILWANRGGGKSLVAAVLIFICLIYRKKSFVDMAGSGEQAKRVYEYTKEFWKCIPGLQTGMLSGEPLVRLTRMKGNVKLVCASSDSQAVGEHLPGFVADESCTGSTTADAKITRSMQGSLDMEDFLIFLLSTFHVPVGLFQETWDNADAKGFKRYKWNCYDTMKTCEHGLETATKEDPKALRYCETECPLTRLEEEKDKFGRITGHEWRGCHGRARKSEGWQTRRQVIEKYVTNLGTRLYMVEHECNRPEWEGKIYNPALVDQCVVAGFELMNGRPMVAGIDWGLTECFMVLLGEWEDDEGGSGIGVVATRVMSNKLTDEVIEQLGHWQVEFETDKIFVRADASHNYSNQEVREAGFRVKAIKGDRKKIGEHNLGRWIGSGLLKILSTCSLLVEQLKRLRQDSDGKQIKQNKSGVEGDHGPDALKFASWAFDCREWLNKLLDDEEKAAEESHAGK
jgi:hypothetical protein